MLLFFNVRWRLLPLGVILIGVTWAFGLAGYLFMRLDLDAAPLMLGFILGPMLEENFRRALLISRGQFSTFVTRPISGTLIGLIALFIVWQAVAFFVRQRGAAVAAPQRQQIPA